MSKKGFMYSGTVFLIMIAVIISANYLFLSSHSKEQSKNLDLQIDLFQSLTGDINAVLVRNKNNTVTDAISDAAFCAIKYNPSGTASDVCKRMNPAHLQAATSGCRADRWALNYSNITLYEINALIHPAEFTHQVSLYYRPNNCETGSNFANFIFGGNITYSLVTSTPSMRITKTVFYDKSVTITKYSSNPPSFTISIFNVFSDELEFQKNVVCSGTCYSV